MMNYGEVFVNKVRLGTRKNACRFCRKWVVPSYSELSQRIERKAVKRFHIFINVAALAMMSTLHYTTSAFGEEMKAQTQDASAFSVNSGGRN
ncbi:unnamed protein product [Ceratitis capitata]|uniref:(Mediterranean fruit fly) hypothetical protein n=1 Tax=Ceratitis capitata TaxID=7213 RepID=A0A811V1B2_CERCA|nr:unnamed protein product [Ceratitis capitata]CAD7004876.1 unnamed protein product [Ceratitis capitata]